MSTQAWLKDILNAYADYAEMGIAEMSIIDNL